MKINYLIGQFAKESGISKRMLRHYEQLGLLIPDSVDEENGYRYYSENQLKQADQIKYLSHLGFTLKEIVNLFDEPMSLGDFLDQLKDKEANFRVSIDVQVSHLAKIQQLIEHLTITDSEGFTLQHLDQTLIMKGNQMMNLKTAMDTLPTYANFYDHIHKTASAIEGTKTFITFDIDNFASVNEESGYDAGDKVILQYYQFISTAFSRLLEKSTNIICRKGGDEFGVFVLGDAADAINAAAMAIESMGSFDFRVHGARETITASCGIYQSETSSDERQLSHESVKALLDAKRNGRNQVNLVKS